MKHILSLLISTLFFNCTPSNTEADKTDTNSINASPNIVLILADDMGWSDIGCYGSEVQTPHIDKLAQNGIRFTQVYNTAKCFPSRACLLTGLYSQRTGYNKNYKQPMDHAITLGELFKTAGYTTMWSGKHHSTERPTTRGFDHYSGLFEGASNHFNTGKQRAGEEQPAQKRPDRPWVLDGKLIQPYTPEKDFYTTDAFTDYALNWLDQHKEKENPFFLYLAYTAPHDPLMAWPEDIAKYRGKYLQGYEATRQARFAKQKKLGLLPEDYPLSESMYQAWDELTEAEKDTADLKMAVYAAMIDRMDQNIGRVSAKLEELGKTENTLIIFVSDNGASAEMVNIKGTGEIGTLSRWTSLGGDWANVANTPLRFYKNWSHEGGIKTPMIAHWPKGIKQTGSLSSTPLHFIDFMATFSDLLNVDYPKQFNEQEVLPLDGISFLPILKGEKIQRTEPLFWEWNKGKAIRDGDWKLVAYKNKWALYDLKNDPVEANDLAEMMPQKVEALKAKYQEWAEEVGME